MLFVGLTGVSACLFCYVYVFCVLCGCSLCLLCVYVCLICLCGCAFNGLLVCLFSCLVYVRVV